MICAVGQDSHRFEEALSSKVLVLGGVPIAGCPGLSGNSDADVILHALTNAISGLSGVNILGARSDQLCLEKGIVDSRMYLAEALATLGKLSLKHISISVEGSRPRMAPHISAIKESVGRLCGIAPSSVGLTATTGEDLTSFGKGEGMAATVIVTAE